MAVGDGGGGGGEDEVNGVGAGYSLQVSCSVGVVIWESGLGGDRVHDKSTGVIPSSGRDNDCRDDAMSYDDRRVGVAPDG